MILLPPPLPLLTMRSDASVVKHEFGNHIQAIQAETSIPRTPHAVTRQQGCTS